MTAANKRLAQKAIAMVVIVAILDVVGISPALIVFFFVAGFLIWRAVVRSNRQEAREIFDFYVAADEILRDEERHWYGFEIAEVIGRGERLAVAMPDPPSLLYFALGALRHRCGDYEAAVEDLAPVIEGGLIEEHDRSAPSPQLRHYVQMLRNIEREPAVAPLALAAIRNLERARRHRGPGFLADSRERSALLSEPVVEKQVAAEPSEKTASAPAERTAGVLSSPRPIAEVLHEVYHEEERPS